MTTSQDQFDLLLLAGGSSGALAQKTGTTHKALIPLLDRPLFHWTLQALQASEVFRRILVAGPYQIRHQVLASVGWFPGTGSAVLNTLLYADYLSLRNRSQGSCLPVVIACCDAPLLTPSLVRSTLKTMSRSDADIVVNVVRKEMIEQLAPGSPRTYWEVDGGLFKPSVFFLVRNPAGLWRCALRLFLLRRVRKSPSQGSRVLGGTLAHISDIEDRLCRLTGQSVSIQQIDHPELAFDVDKPSDLADARKVLREHLQRSKKTVSSSAFS